MIRVLILAVCLSGTSVAGAAVCTTELESRALAAPKLEILIKQLLRLTATLRPDNTRVERSFFVHLNRQNWLGDHRPLLRSLDRLIELRPHVRDSSTPGRTLHVRGVAQIRATAEILDATRQFALVSAETPSVLPFPRLRVGLMRLLNPDLARDHRLAEAFSQFVNEDLDGPSGLRTYAHLTLNGELDQIYWRDPRDGTPELLIISRR